MIRVLVYDNGEQVETNIDHVVRVTCDECGKELTGYNEINLSVFKDGSYEVFCDHCI
jgi:hypothetical protein